MHIKFSRFALLSVSVLALAACSSTSKDKQKIPDQPPEQLYAKAEALLKDGQPQKAKELFDEVERQHPYSDYATKAQLRAAESAYENLRYDEAVAALDRFIDLHPGHPQIDYAYYMKAMCYYEQISDVTRDQQITKDALENLNIVVERFPDSKYGRDATYKRDLTLDHLAGKEMEIGRYYLKRNEINAAINRFRAVIKDYQTTTHTPEALHRLVEAYTTLGLKDEATHVAAVLGHNYPGSSWYMDSYDLLDPSQRARLKDNQSLLKRTMDSLLKAD